MQSEFRYFYNTTKHHDVLLMAFVAEALQLETAKEKTSSTSMELQRVISCWSLTEIYSILCLLYCFVSEGFLGHWRITKTDRCKQ